MAQWHGMDDEFGAVCEFEPHDFEQVAGVVGSDGEDLGRVSVGLEVDDGKGVTEGVTYGLVVDTVPAGGVVNLHITIV